MILTIKDAVLARGLAASPKEAEGLILAGKVLVNDVPVTKTSAKVTAVDAIRVRGVKKFVSRAGDKLDAALDTFGIAVQGKGFLDIGASTGGFTDALLQRGARFVAAVDVGKGLLHHRLATDPRVQVLEGVDFKNLEPAILREKVDAFVADVSFTSLETIIPKAFALLSGKGAIAEGIVLFKPQFELAKSERNLLQKGVLQDTKKSAQLLLEFEQRLANLGIRVAGSMPATVKGRKGNQEYVLHLSCLPVD